MHFTTHLSTRLRRGMIVQLREGAGRIIRVTESAAVVRLQKFETVMFGARRVRLRRERLVRISPNAPCPILRS